MPKIRDYRIVIAEKATFNERRAAAFVRSCVRNVTGAVLPIVSEKEEKVPLEIVIGHTSREDEDGIVFDRSRKSLWEFVLRFSGERLYLAGLGLPAEPEEPYKSPYAVEDDGAWGTSIAAYRFAEDILKYDFLYDAYLPYPDSPEIEMPTDVEINYFKDALKEDHAPVIEGPGFWAVPSAAIPNWNMGCLIFRSREGRIVLIDGGFSADAPRVIRLLQEITGKEVPEIEALLFTHLHEDHYGFITRLATDEELQGKIVIKNFYHHLLPDEYYTTLSKEAKPERIETLEKIRSMETLGTALHTVEKGDILTVDDLNFKVLHTPDLSIPTMNMNNASVVWRMDHESGQRFLLLADSEWVGSNSLMTLPEEELKAEVVQVGHHGVGNVSRACYERIGGKVFLYQACPRFWYSDRGEGLGSHVIGMARNLGWLMDLGAKKENIYATHKGIIALPLPAPVK